MRWAILILFVGGIIIAGIADSPVALVPSPWLVAIGFLFFIVGLLMILVRAFAQPKGS